MGGPPFILATLGAFTLHPRTRQDGGTAHPCSLPASNNERTARPTGAERTRAPGRRRGTGAVLQDPKENPASTGQGTRGEVGHIE